MSAARRRRALVQVLHLWLGLGLGAVFVVLGLTGSWLAFYPEIDRLRQPPTSVATSPPTLAAVVAALRAAEPARDGPWRIELAPTPDAPIKARYYRPAETRERGFAPLLVTIDPGTLAVGDRHFWGEGLSTWLYDLHYTLLLGAGGKTLLATLTLALIALLASGLYLWWPAPGRWRQALAIKRQASRPRRIYDLHVKPGVYALPLLLVLAGSGLMLLVPHWFAPAIAWLSPPTPAFQAPADAAAAPAISADAALAIARREFPAAEPRWLETPGRGHAAWRVQLRQPGEPNRRFPRTHVWIDPATGAILAIRDPLRQGAGDTLLAWLHPLHNGEAFGLAGRLVVCLSGLLPLLALVTGFLRWRHKREARATSARRRIDGGGPLAAKLR
ncbi:PepSY-associated TM helix domain-containing protein [Azonexus fungiphilus]|uniref:PepSY-associated TM helix domain-containing protein n=1 Tax=Azonexus fungiphilus TaxID=146940 RepID=UPI00156AF742|nr:PepSY-associated TM helix domain-containing protein [Azonexus fungiphilus]NHC07486.1 PepSY domain-containing protein [Azonexus fungiphilus]